MLGGRKISHTAGCMLVPVRVWGCLVVPVMHLGVFGKWVNMAREQTLLGKSCRPLQTLSRESRALSRLRRGAGLGARQPVPVRYLHPQLPPASIELPCTPAGRLNQQEVYQEDWKGFKGKPSAQTGTGLAVQSDKWNRTQLGLMWSFLLKSTNWSMQQLWTEDSPQEILNFIFTLFISRHKPFLMSLDKWHISIWLKCWFSFLASS